MSTLFLIGNGFDVNCGMKTRYSDVYEKYVKEDSSSDVIKRFKEEIDSNIENWGDFEMAMANYSRYTRNEEEFLECVRDFANYMEIYLVEEVGRFKQKLKNDLTENAVQEEFAKSFETFYVGISHNVNDIMESRNAKYIGNINSISFNYTDIFDILWDEFYRRSRRIKNKIVHIHGTLQDDPVFGVDNIDQIEKGYMLSRRGRRGFIKPVFNDEYDRQRVQQSKMLIESANTICTFGMSLGDSDLTWRNILIEWLKASEDNHLFIYQYKLSESKYRTVSEKMDIEEAEKERMLSKWGVDESDSIFEQIHIPCGKNIFNIGKVIKNVEKERFEKEEIMLAKRLETGKMYIEQHLQDAVGE